MRRSTRSDIDRQIDRLAAGDTTGEGGLDAFWALLIGEPSLEERGVEALAVELSAEALESAPPEHERLDRLRRPMPAPWRRRAAFSTVASSLVAKIAFAGVAFAATTGGLAASGNLPDPAQQVLSDVAARIGITLPAAGGHTEDLTEPTDLEELDLNDTELLHNDPVREAPELPDEASDTAREVLEVVFDSGLWDEIAEFGMRVSEIASQGRAGAPHWLDGLWRPADGRPPWSENDNSSNSNSSNSNKP